MSSQKQKRKRRKRQDHLVLNLLIIVTLVLVVFEGRLVMTMFKQRSSSNTSTTAEAPNTATVSKGTTNTSSPNSAKNATSSDTSSGSNSTMEVSLAGLPDTINTTGSSDNTSSVEKLPTVSDPSSPAIVQKSDTAVDDSYFADAVFIGDSRMEGFRNASGITQGRFFTSVGMSLSSMAKDSIIQTPEGNITVAAALSGGTYNKIYIMLGTNDLGEYDWNSFREGFVSVTKRFKEIQPSAIVYICSVIYVEESKVASSEYVNNTNVDTINSILLDICEEQGYYYLDLNEFLSNGYGSLIEGASSDGVHIYPDYCKQMLEYLKSHYIAVNDPSEDTSIADETESETEQAEGSV